MKEIDIFEVKKGDKCGVVNLPRKHIGRKVKVVLIEKSDENSTIDNSIELLQRSITRLQFKLDNLIELKKQRINRKAIKNDNKG